MQADRLAHPEWYLLVKARHRAKQKGISFDLREEDVVIPERCPVLGVELFISSGRGGGPKYNSPSLDRIDPDRGYVRDNVRVVSARANTLKSNATLTEMRLVLADLERIEAASSCPHCTATLERGDAE